ncbi:MAG TPA: diaminopimelate epimerase [Candidatus Saccharimonadales bacterium]|jgi:diaminopimelate epimerase|nr:diaminopimelate epimerase [Candidatus Saccharimonadales bacterium]
MIPFIKASACGNDFLMIDGAHATGAITDLTRQICDRHNGVGADGVEWLFPAPDADIEARLINADGSPAEISGNGTRCVAACLASQSAKTSLSIRTGAGVKHCNLISRDGNLFEFETAMGTPVAGGEITIDGVKGMEVSVGNPHFAVFVAAFAANWQELGAAIGRHPHFPQGVNVEFVRVTGVHDIEVRFFERGAGETHSSGTGSCASAVAAVALGKLNAPVNVHAPGGTQTVRWAGDRIFLRGPARIICRGEFLVQ